MAIRFFLGINITTAAVSGAGAGGACARALAPVARAVSPWARAGPRAHGTASRGPLSGDGGDGESRGFWDGREAPYLP